MYVTARKHFAQGVGKYLRIKYTLPPLVFAALSVAEKVKVMSIEEGNEGLLASAKKVFKFVHETISALRWVSLSKQPPSLCLSSSHPLARINTSLSLESTSLSPTLVGGMFGFASFPLNS